MSINRFKAMSKLMDCALRSPHERLMQLVFNALDAQGKARHPDGTPRDVFYVTDDELCEALDRYLHN